MSEQTNPQTGRYYDGSWTPSGYQAPQSQPFKALPLAYPMPADWNTDANHASARDFNQMSSAPALDFYR